MLVTVKHAIPGEPLPIMYSAEREEMVFQIDFTNQAREMREQGEGEALGPGVGVVDTAGEEGEGDAGVAQVFLLNCRTFDLWVYDATQVGQGSSAHPPTTVDELLLLIAASPTPAGVPLIKVPPDPEGEKVLQRILDRDASVIPLLEEEYLGYAPRATTREEELVNADEAARATREKLREAIEVTREGIKEAEGELQILRGELDSALQEAAGAGLEGEAREKVREQLEADVKAYTELRAAVDEAKGKLAGMVEVYKARHPGETVLQK